MKKIIRRIQAEVQWIKIHKQDIKMWAACVAFTLFYILGSAEWIF